MSGRPFYSRQGSSSLNSYPVTGAAGGSSDGGGTYALYASPLPSAQDQQYDGVEPVRAFNSMDTADDAFRLSFSPVALRTSSGSGNTADDADDENENLFGRSASSSSPTTSTTSSSDTSSSSEDSDDSGSGDSDDDDEDDSIGSSVSRAAAKRRRRDHRGVPRGPKGTVSKARYDKSSRGGVRQLLFHRSRRHNTASRDAKLQAYRRNGAGNQYARGGGMGGRNLRSPKGAFSSSSSLSPDDRWDSPSGSSGTDSGREGKGSDSADGVFDNSAESSPTDSDDDDDADDNDASKDGRVMRRARFSDGSGDSSPSRSDTDDDSDATRDKDGEPAASGYRVFWDQFLANCDRMIVERKRSLLIFASEVIIPVTFLVVTVIAGIALKTFSYDEMQPLDYTSPVILPLAPRPYLQFMCASANATRSDGLYEGIPLVPGLLPCENVSFPSVSCDGDDSTLPVRGLCYRGDMTGREVVLLYLGQLMGNLSYVPDFDTMVLYQWLARKSMSGEEDAIQQTIAAAGFISNTVANVILRSGTLHFAPRTPAVTQLVEYLNRTTVTFPLVYGQTFASNEAARSFVAEGEGPTWAIVHARSLTTANFDVQIQVNQTALPKFTDRIDPLYSGGFQLGRAELYFASGFLTLQKVLYSFYLEGILPEDSGLSASRSGFVPYLMTMGSVPYKQSQMLLSASFIISFITTNAFLYPVTMIAKRIVVEKELRLEEAMYIMGMGQLPRVLSTVVFNFIFLLLLCALMSMVVKCGFQSQSDYFIIYLVFLVYSLACIALALFLASFFSKSRLVVLVTPLAYFVMTVPIFAINNAPGVLIMALSWLPPTAFAGALNVMYQHEVRGGFRHEHFFDPLDDPKLAHQLFILLGDTVVYFLLALYFENVLPKDCGTPRHPFFFILDPIRACCGGSGNYDRTGGRDGRDPNGVYEDEEGGGGAGARVRGNDDSLSVEVIGLRKEYKRNGKKFCAVDNLYLNFEVGGISVLLGHNGAGKSTAFNMMNGMTKPDAGDCLVYGVSVRDNLRKVRQELGFCPQHNILWPDLTCREHLEFFGRIKGLRGTALEDAVQRILYEVDLLDMSEYRARELSGGMKRKLSVAIAFVGGSRLVFLDEPTGGMDVAARRHTWELLLRMSTSRTILLTTHFMDEADLLGDFVAIMTNGRLKCAGSSLFLKSRLGVGYSVALSVFSPSDHAAVERLVLGTVEGAETLERKGLEAQYQLPASEVSSFPKLLQTMERNGEDYGIRGFTLSATTMEEVFMKVAEEDLKHSRIEGAVGGSSLLLMDTDGRDRLAAQQSTVWDCELIDKTGDLIWMQFVTSFKKRLYNAKRDRRMICFQIVCPILCVLLAMLLNLIKFTGTTTLDFMEPYYTPTEVITAGCDATWTYPAPSYEQQGITVTDMAFQNAQDLNYYLIDTWYHHRTPGRYMAYMCNDTSVQGIIRGLGLTPVPSPLLPFQPVVGLYNVSSEHEVAAAMMHMYSSRVMTVLPGHDVLKTTAETLPATRQEETVNGGLTAILMGCVVMIPFTFLPSNCVAWVVKERECKSRHLQNLIGLRYLLYWGANFLFDMIAYLVTMAIVIIIFAIFQREEYIGKEAVGATIVLFLVYGVAGTTAAYALSYIFSHAPTAQTTVMIAGFSSGFLLVMLVFIFNLVLSTQEASRIMRWPSRVIPTYCVGEAIINMATIEQTRLNEPSLTPWSMKVIGWPCVFMAAEVPVFVAITLLLDHPKLRHWRERRAYRPDAAPDRCSGEDTDVEDEREQTLRETDYLVRGGARRSRMSQEERARHPDPDPVSVVRLKKTYPNGKVAVRDLTFMVVPGEVFGFLGTNGAGKTTAISVLCQEFLPTSGRAFICGYDTVDEAAEALRMVGYCPQFDATLDLLTVEEHLRVFAGIRGIVRDAHDDVVDALLGICDLYEYRHVLAGELSGGNRRKLSVALSLVGGPQVVFLDEPSAGMDPIARRGLWASISAVGEMCSIVLTTHHLEEVEALADTVAIMVDGGLRCIGSKTHLKNKYGRGFEMSIRVARPEARPLVEDFMATHFPEATLNEDRTGRFVYALPKTTLLSNVFRLLQSRKDDIGITDYTVSQTSIEQVFMRISEDAAAAEVAAVTRKLGRSGSSSRRSSFNFLPW